MNTARHEDERQHVSDVIRSERLRRGWSVGDAAERVGVAASAWSRWETSTSLPRPKMMQSIGTLLALPDDWMIPPAVSQPSRALDLDERLARIEDRQQEILEQVRARDRRIDDLYRFGALRREIAMLLGSALRDDEQHLAGTERREGSGPHEPERRGERRLDEVTARDAAHLRETAARGGADIRDLGERNDLNAEQLESLKLAVESRDLMEQAKGVIMASMECSPDEAFRLIAKQSQHENRKVIEVATEIVQRVTSRERPAVTPGTRSTSTS